MTSSKRIICLWTLALVACGRSDAEEAVASTFVDPSAARFQSVTSHGGAVCGEVNAGQEASAKGYMRFVYRPGVVSVAPHMSYSTGDLAAFEATCRMLGGKGNGLDREVCTRSAEARRTSDRAAAFETLWQRSCG